MCLAEPKRDIRIRYIMEYFYIQIFQIVRTKFCCSCLVVVRSLLPVRLISGRGLAVLGVVEIPGVHLAAVPAGTRQPPAISSGDAVAARRGSRRPAWAWISGVSTVTGSAAAALGLKPSSQPSRPVIWWYWRTARRAGRTRHRTGLARSARISFQPRRRGGPWQSQGRSRWPPHSYAPVFAATARRLARACLAQNSPKKADRTRLGIWVESGQ